MSLFKRLTFLRIFCLPNLAMESKRCLSSFVKPWSRTLNCANHKKKKNWEIDKLPKFPKRKSAVESESSLFYSNLIYFLYLFTLSSTHSSFFSFDYYIECVLLKTWLFSFFKIFLFKWWKLNVDTKERNLSKLFDLSLNSNVMPSKWFVINCLIKLLLCSQFFLMGNLPCC